jgi:hypothetical protein
VLILGGSSDDEIPGTHERAGCVKIPQVAAFKERRVHVLRAVMQLDGMLCQEMIRGPDVEPTPFAPNGIADNLAIICVA